MVDVTSCCPPGRGPIDDHGASSQPEPEPEPEPATRRTTDDTTMVAVPGGQFKMGAVGIVAYDGDGEGPIHMVELTPYRIAATCVTNDDFVAFIDDTGYVTEAERYGWSFVFGGLLPEDFEPTRAAAQTPWWRQVYGADWCHPEGPHSDVSERARHPVIHVSWHDAMAYCAWGGTRLPTEAEWERAGRGGLNRAVFPWGDELEPAGHHMMNVFQGEFPLNDTGDDGWIGTSPVDAYEPNGYGVYNMTGNVWEWCADWFSPAYYRDSARRDPHGPANGTSRVMRGGSYLCHDSYCYRYRVAARSSNTPESSSGNLGFRCANSAV
jgi:formylglycine-generating enzyme required for sulfatase activity